MDYFGFRRGSIGEISPMVAGAVLLDNFMVRYFRQLGLRVIDATRDVFAIHQTHGYEMTASCVRVLEEGPAARHNRRILEANDIYCIHTPPTARDATFYLRGRKLFPAWTSPEALIHRLHATALRGLRRTGLYHFVKRLAGRKP